MLKTVVDWLKKNLAFILCGLAIFIMALCFVSGCNYHKNHFKCPEITTNTVILHDTIIHQVIDTFPFYIVKRDTIIYTDVIIQPVDTAAILQNYFALHVYDRKWYGLDSLTKDSLLYVNIHDTITQNRSIGNKFQYKILRPQTITYNSIDNSVLYAKYLYAGLDIPFYNAEFSELSLLFAFKRGYIGAGYAPMARGFSLKTGVKLFTWD